MRLRFTVRSRLTLSFLLILLIPSLVIGLISYQTAKSKVQDDMMQSATQNVQMLNSLITELVAPKESDVQLLSNILNTQNTSNDFGIIQSYQKLHPELEEAYLATDTGVFIDSPHTQHAAGWDARKRPWYIQAMQNEGQVIITAPYVSVASHDVTVTIARSTKDNKGVFAVDLSLKSLNDIISKAKIGQKGYVVIADANKKWVNDPGVQAGSDVTASYDLNMYKNASGTQYYTLNGQPKYEIYDTNSLTGWKIAGTMYTQEFADAAQPIFHKTLLVIGLALVLGVLFGYFVIRSIVAPLLALKRASERISEGDLTELISVQKNDEIGDVGRSFNTMAASLKSVLSQVYETASQLSASAEELTASAEQSAQASEQTSVTMQELAAGVEQQVQSVEETDRTVHEMSVGIQQIASTAQTVSHSAVQASEVAWEGNESIQKAIQQMNRIHTTVHESERSISALGEHAENIGKIVAVITAIADQTNLLALNAAIEAARAGEQGRGFAVVADEVRKLAEKSSESAKQIADYIATIQGEIQKAVQSMELGTKEVVSGLEVVDLAGASFEQIQSAVGQVATQIQEVSAAVQQMAAGGDQIVRAIDFITQAIEKTAAGTQTVSASTEEQLASMEEITSSAASLSEIAAQLETLIQKFKL